MVAISAAETGARPSFEAYGCLVNALEPAELVARYERAGFLYPAKRERLAPFLPAILENWRRAMRGGELIHFVVTHEDRRGGGFASVTSWRSTHAGWSTQHLVSTGGPAASRNVLLATQAAQIHNGVDHSQHCWYQPANRYPTRLFGSVERSLGPELSSVRCYEYVALPLRRCPRRADGVHVEPWTDPAGVFELACEMRGQVYAQAEELDHEDLELETVDALYRLVGLRRFRRVWLAWLPAGDRPAGAAIAYRGPLGFNFSLLENRCDLLVQPQLSREQSGGVAAALCAAAASAYGDFAPAFLPVVTDERTAALLADHSATPIRRYAQSIWLAGGFQAFYGHLERFYARIEHAGRRRGLASNGAIR
jgi:hypothetical protein